MEEFDKTEQDDQLPEWFTQRIKDFDITKAWLKVTAEDKKGLNKAYQFLGMVKKWKEGKLPDSHLAKFVSALGVSKVHEHLSAIEVLVGQPKESGNSFHLHFVENQYKLPETSADLMIFDKISPLTPKSFALIKESIKEYYLDKEKYIFRVMGVPSKLSIDKSCFINLAIVKKEVQTQIESDKLNIPLGNRLKIYGNYADIFKIEKNVLPKDLFNRAGGKFPKRLLVIGRAGIGKSTLSQSLTYNWSKGELWQEEFHLIFKIKLRDLTTDNYNNGKTSLAHIIAKECFSSVNFTEETRFKIATSVEAILNDSSKKILFILDGFDEFSPESSSVKNTINDLINSENRHNFYLILTSRIYAENLHSINFDLNLECMGFSSEDVVNYIKLEELQLSHHFQESIIEFLTKNITIQTLVHIPLMLDILCAIWDGTLPQNTNSMTITTFYSKFTQKLWETYNHRQLNLDPTHANLRDRLNVTTHIERTNRAKRFLELLAFQAMKRNKIMLEATLILKTVRKIEG